MAHLIALLLGTVRYNLGHSYFMNKLYKHHIVPKHMDGSNDSSNIKLVTLEQHAEEHRILWEKYGKKEDFLAWKCISGQIPVQEVWLELNKLNGAKQGRKNVESGHILKIRKLVDLTKAGKNSSKVCREKKVNSFFDPKILKEVRKKGGHTQGLKNAESGHLQRISLLPRKYTQKQWYTNGIDSILVKQHEQIPKGYKKGRLCPRKKN